MKCAECNAFNVCRVASENATSTFINFQLQIFHSKNSLLTFRVFNWSCLTRKHTHTHTLAPHVEPEHN